MQMLFYLHTGGYTKNMDEKDREKTEKADLYRNRVVDLGRALCYDNKAFRLYERTQTGRIL